MQQHVPLSTHRLFVDRRGPEHSKRTLLFVHGFPLNHTMWSAQLDELSQDFDMLAVDLPGYGQSSQLTRGTSMAEMADCLAELLDSLAIETVTLCGLSMGGYIGWEFWNRHVSRLDGLICANTKAEADDDVTQRARSVSAQAADRNGIEWVAETMLPKLLGPEVFASQPEVVKKVQQMILATKLTGHGFGQLAMAKRSDATGWLKQIVVPTLVIAGSSDPITPADEMKKMAAAIPNSTFVEISDAGHLTPIENPIAFNTAVRDFLRAEER